MSSQSAVLFPRAAGRLIAETSKDVKISPAGISKVAKVMYECVKNNEYSIKSWKEHELNPTEMNDAAVDWIFLCDTLNFSFFSMDENKKYCVKYGDKTHTGYWSLCAAVNRALDRNIPITDPKYYSIVSKQTLAEIFKSDSEYDIPLLDERHDVLTQAGKVLMKKYDGSFVNCIKQCNKSAQTLLKLVIQDFESYRDEADHNGKRVAFYKRAQILIADIWGCFEGTGYGEFHDIDTITMFADYRIPQALVYFGALEYSKKLNELLQKDELLQNGDRIEIEIRGCSIRATELICKEAQEMLKNDTDAEDCLLNEILIDHYLWDYRREHAHKMTVIPFHKLRCIYY